MNSDRLEIYTWEPGDGTQRRYCINIALNLIAFLNLQPHPIVTLDLCREAIARNSRVGELLQADIDRADLSKPIIHMIRDTPQGPRHILIDGWHRVCKAVKTNHPEPLSCYVLPEEIAELCRL